MKERCFKFEAMVDQTAVHYGSDGWLLHKASEEAKKQVGSTNSLLPDKRRTFPAPERCSGRCPVCFAGCACFWPSRPDRSSRQSAQRRRRRRASRRTWSARRARRRRGWTTSRRTTAGGCATGWGSPAGPRARVARGPRCADYQPGAAISSGQLPARVRWGSRSAAKSAALGCGDSFSTSRFDQAR